MFARIVRLSAVFFVVALGLTCQRQQESPPKPNVILISLDTVRRDAIGVYGSHASSPTPRIDELAQTSVRFDSAWAPIPFTLPSHMSLLTGLHPETHQVMQRTHALDESIPTLAELATAAGYRCLGLVSNIWMKGEFGFARGFDHYERIRVGLTYADRINLRIFELLDRPDKADQPHFVFLHYIDAHSDYNKAGANHLPYYAPPELLANFGLTADSRVFCDEEGNCGTKFLVAANRTGRVIDQPTIDTLADLYLAGLTLLDFHIGRLLDGLEERGLLENSILIITSDHGEEFREHGRFVHAQPYVESLGVPLLVRFPRGAHSGRVVDDPVELADLMPSILNAMKIEVPAHIPARDVFSPVLRAIDPDPAPILGSDKVRHERFALRNEHHTLIADLDTGERELYDRRADPTEHHDLAASEPELTAELEQRLLEVLERYRLLGSALRTGETGAGTDALTAEEEEQLRAIGYLE